MICDASATLVDSPQHLSQSCYHLISVEVEALRFSIALICCVCCALNQSGHALGNILIYCLFISFSFVSIA